MLMNLPSGTTTPNVIKFVNGKCISFAYAKFSLLMLCATADVVPNSIDFVYLRYDYDTGNSMGHACVRVL